MAEELSVENILIQVRSKLQRNKIQLWLPPYYSESDGAVMVFLETLAKDFAASLDIPYDKCIAALCDLQNNAIEKLQAKLRFKDEGIATLKIRAPHTTKNNIFTIHIRLSETGICLQDLIAKKLDVLQERVKLISAGKVITLDKTLEEQLIVNNQQVMALLINNPNTSSDTATKDAGYDLLKKTRDDAYILISRESQHMQMEDQDGNAIHLPINEKQSIMMALALHEKGKSLFGKQNYNDALIFFLEADQEYNNCTSEILNSVDNYALLNLDIVWCYLCLKSVTQLPDADRRLQICERKFKKSYGENFERLVAVKGTSGNERALIMRLHLLQAVILFHQNRRYEAREYFALAGSELAKLKIDNDDVLLLVQMGFTDVEARVSLRACEGNVDKAITFIIEKRNKRKLAAKRQNSEHNFHGLIETLTKDYKAKNGWINPRSLNTLVEMGYEKEICAVALKRCDNDIHKAIECIQNDKSSLIIEAKSMLKPSAELIQELVSFGFPYDIAKWALNRFFNNKNEAINALLKMKEQGTYDEFQKIVLEKERKRSTTQTSPNANDGAGTSSSSTSSSSSSSSSVFGASPLTTYAKEYVDRMQESEEAFTRFSEDIEQTDDSYLDLTLIDEENILSEYRAYLDM